MKKSTAAPAKGGSAPDPMLSDTYKHAPETAATVMHDLDDFDARLNGQAVHASGGLSHAVRPRAAPTPLAVKSANTAQPAPASKATSGGLRLPRPALPEDEVEQMRQRRADVEAVRSLPEAGADDDDDDD